MYLPSDTPLLTQDRENAARAAACSDGRIQAMRRTSALGRVALFNTLIAPSSVQQNLGIGAAIDTAKLQQQTETSRATAILGTSVGPQPGPDLAEIIRNAPEVVSLNRGGGCQVKVATYQPALAVSNPQPSMPQQAPTIIQTSQGQLNIQGAPSTLPGSYPQERLPQIGPLLNLPRVAPGGSPMQYDAILNNGGGLTGYAPPWSDAWVMQVAEQSGANDTGVGSGVGGWIADHPWLSLAIAAGGALALSRRSRR